MHNQYESKIQNPELVTLVSLGSEKVKEKLSEGWDPNVQNKDGISPALKAAERNDLKTLKLLIDAGASVDLADMAGITPLKCAQFNKNAEMIKLIENTMQINSNNNKNQRNH